MKQLIPSILASVSLTITTLEAAEFHVSPTMGSDRNNGSESNPFQTLERAAGKMGPGDVCWLRNGRYQTETVLEGIKGEPGKPLTFKPYPGERAIMDGTSKLPPRWTPWKNRIYKMKIKEPVWQLFSGNKLVYVARWPNASFEDGSIWRMEECMRFTDREIKQGKATGKTGDGIICDRNPESHEGNSADEGAVRLRIKGGINQTTLAETGSPRGQNAYFIISRTVMMK